MSIERLKRNLRKPLTIPLMVFAVMGLIAGYSYINTLPLDPQIYESLLLDLEGEGYEILRYKDVLEGNNKTGKFCVLAHDVDGLGYGLRGVEIFEKIERSLNVRSSFFIRVDHDYFLSSLRLFQRLEGENWEIGFHYNSLSIAKDMSLALRLFEGQLSMLRSVYNVSSIRPHGDCRNLQINNGVIWEDHKAFCQLLGVESFEGFDTYIRDTNKHIVIPSKTEWGNRILLNFHADWYK